MKRFVVLLLLGGMLVAACGDDAGEAAVPTTVAEPSDGLPLAGDDGATFLAGMGPGISVADALEAAPGEDLLINGYLFVYADGSVVFADVIAESYPPQPAGASISVEGLDLMQIPLTEGSGTELEITAWTDQPIQVLGRIVDGALVATSVASA